MQGPVQRTRINHMIRLSPIRLIDQDGEQVGVIDTQEALRMAQNAGLDLVEISPDARPPVCKIMDYGKYKYELSKKEQKGKSTGHELKEIRLGRSIKIDPHDVQIRVNQARRFLMAGHKVQITQRFRGREMAHKELGEERLIQVCQDLSDVAKIEIAPRAVGRAITLVLAPDKVKIEQIKAQLAKEGKQAEEDLEKLEAEVAAQNAAIDAEDDHDDSDDDKKSTKKQRGPKDDRAGNPVDDEVADLLGEL
ncbi:MAG: translation initiation factor IF-3 [Planctomycetota bacterium]|nr:MAG: translation initiation factor IF-3 [Planctomycetota bacterium]